MEDHGHRASVVVGNKNGYARSGKVMLASIIIVFSLIIIIACFHTYANRARRRRHHHNRRLTTAADTKNSDALDFSVLKSLPTFLYSTTRSPPLECAVCLSEFESSESGRILPNCKHCFHTECIDMWFESHSTCPLCRAPVKPVEFVALSIDDEPAGPSGLYRPGWMRSSASTPALLACLGSEREIERKRGGILGICIEEVPSSNDSRGGGVFKSPGVLSLRRIWSF